MALNGRPIPFLPASLGWGEKMDEKNWLEYKQKTRTYAVRIDFALLHSEVYKKITYSPTLKMLNWFHEKVKVKVNKRKKGRNRFQILNGDISFTYEEAKHRGLSYQQTSRALKELYRFGFIDVKQPGSALRGDWTRFALSTRWKNYGQSDFKEMEFPMSIKWRNYGFGSNEKPGKKNYGKKKFANYESSQLQ